MNAARSSLVAAGGEVLLELVDREHERRPRPTPSSARSSSRSGCSPGRMTTCAQPSLPGSTPLGERGQQAGAQDRRLAAARRPDDAEQRRADEPGDELGDEPLAAEEVRRVGDLERREPLERAHDRRAVVARQRGALARRLQLDDVAGQLGLHRAQLGAAGRGPPGDRAHPARRLAPRPLAGDARGRGAARRRWPRAATRRARRRPSWPGA